MGRSFISTVSRIARETERQNRAREREAARLQKEQERRAYLALDQQGAICKAQQEMRQKPNDELDQKEIHLKHILTDVISGSTVINLNSYKTDINKLEVTDPALQLPPLPRRELYSPKNVGILGKLVPGWQKRYAAVQAQADAQYRASLGNYNAILDRRQSALAILQIEATAQNSAIDASIDEIRMGEPGAVAGYFDMVLSKLRWPDGFHDERRIGSASQNRSKLL